MIHISTKLKKQARNSYFSKKWQKEPQRFLVLWAFLGPRHHEDNTQVKICILATNFQVKKIKTDV